MEQSEIVNTAKQIGDAMAKTAAAYIEALDRIIPAIREFVYEMAWLKGSTSAHRYALAGYPYGRHTRGKKRFLREMKARHKQC